MKFKKFMKLIKKAQNIRKYLKNEGQRSQRLAANRERNQIKSFISIRLTKT